MPGMDAEIRLESEQYTRAADDARQSTEDFTKSTEAAQLELLNMHETMKATGSAISGLDSGMKGVIRSMDGLGMLTERQAESMQRLSASIGLVEAPMKMLIPLMQLYQTQAWGAMLATTALATAAGGVFVSMQAMNAEGERAKILWSLLAAVIWGAAAAQTAYAIARQYSTLDPVTASIVAGAIVAAIGGGVTYLLSQRAAAGGDAAPAATPPPASQQTTNIYQAPTRQVPRWTGGQAEYV